MATAGTLVYNTKLDTSGIDKGLKGMTGKVQSTGSTIKSILGGLGIATVVSKAVGMINNSLDGAISRFDIMNNFPKVMSNLGIESRDAQESISIMSDKLMGLPTTLDEAALAVQRFTSANGDVKKSTDMFLAVNNAILAGGGSASLQATALEQLSQAYAKGKPDMMEWRTLMTAMPAQLKQVATAMGYVKTADLGEALRNGDVSMDSFLDTIIKLNKQGGEGFTSFEEQARTATSGIQTAVKNMKSRTVQGVTSLIEAINKGLKKTRFKNIAGLLESVGNFFRDNLKKIAKVIEKIPFDKVFKVLKKLAPVVVSVVAGFTAMSGVLKAIKFVNIAKDIGLMLASFGPIGIAVGGVVALTTAITLLTQEQENNKSVTKKTQETLDNYTEAMKNAKEAKEDYLDENLGEVQHYQDLKNELDGLIDKNGKVKKGYEERANFIVSTLNDALGTEIKITDGVIKNYDNVSKSIQKVIDKKKAQIFLDAHEKEYAEAIKQKKDLEKAYADQLEETTNWEKIRNKIIEKAKNETSMSVEEQLKYAAALQYANKNIDKSKDALDKVRDTYGKNNEIIKQFEDATAHMAKGNTDAIIKMYDDTRNYSGMTAQQVYDDYQKRIQQQKDYLEQLKINKQGYDDDFIQKEKKRTEDTIKNLKKEQEQYKQVTQETQDTIKGVWNQGMTDLVEDITGKKVTFKQVGKDSFQMYVDGIEQGKPMSKKKAQEVTQGIVKELKKGKKEGEIAGKDIVNGVDDGINYQKGSAFSTIASFGQGLLNKLKASLKEHSPSKATFEMGEFLDLGVIKGIESSKKKVLKTADLFGKDIIKKMQNAVSLETGNITANANIKGNSFLNSTTVNSHVVADVYMDRTKVGQAVTPIVAQTIRKAGA